jgi:hypothetical protein
MKGMATESREMLVEYTVFGQLYLPLVLPWTHSTVSAGYAHLSSFLVQCHFATAIN